TVQVSSGVFTVALDYGAAAFSGADRFLEIALRPAGSADAYTTLSPRQQLTSAVYAIRAGNAATADAAANASQLGGVSANQYVQTSDSRLSDARLPSEGSPSYIQNTTTKQAASNFNISGSGTAGGTLSATLVNASNYYSIGGSKVLSNPGDNTFVGVGAGAANSQGARNAFFGTLAGNSNSAGSNNSFFGWIAGNVNTGFGNSFFGASSGASNQGASNNSFFGYGAGSLNTNGENNSYFGANAGTVNSHASNNSFFGKDAGTQNVGADNSFFGNSAGSANDAANNNSFFGSKAGAANTSGDNNAFFGMAAGVSNKQGTSNTFVGSAAGYSNTFGGINTFLGYAAGQDNDTGVGNTFLGGVAGESAKGSNNTFVGYASVLSVGNRNDSTALGANTEIALGVTNGTAIGAKAEVDQDNSLVLGSTNGVNGATKDTNVGIGTTAPKTRFHLATNNGNLMVGGGGCNSGFVGIGFGSSLSGCGNYSLLGNGTDTFINRPTGGAIQFRENNVTQMSIADGGLVSINTLGGGGLISLCRNPLNQISTCSSSLRYKTNIQPFARGLSVLNRLRPITFDWKEGGTHDLGFGAEDIAAVEPLLVTRNDKGEVEGVKYDRITAVLVNAVKEQQEQIKEQQSQLVRQQSQLSRQQQQIEQLKRLVAQNTRHRQMPSTSNRGR
ncbi:MAG TPA: tail fiber domain-containing protein, partial [Pyrinomonadaceae bacterium]|nr:tail fiber domain-containing protein [Pyrinomonadaceae bacterium]